MSWTDERVEKLRQLFDEGHSAAQIAKQLGGVTRNAVIGKLHRLGLSSKGQSAPAKADAPSPAPKKAAAAEAPKPAAPKPVEKAPETKAATPPPSAPAAAAPLVGPIPPRAPARDASGRREPQPISEDRLELLARLAEMEKDCKRIPLLELTERVCKWPIGDPTDEDFCFCGLPAEPGKPYCTAHVAAAFQPMSNRRDRNRSR